MEPLCKRAPHGMLGDAAPASQHAHGEEFVVLLGIFKRGGRQGRGPRLASPHCSTDPDLLQRFRGGKRSFGGRLSAAH
eukprot:3051203-Alexandrium_andersonii.AAC.1